MKKVSQSTTTKTAARSASVSEQAAGTRKEQDRALSEHQERRIEQGVELLSAFFKNPTRYRSQTEDGMN